MFEVLKSRRFITLVVGMLVMLVVAYVPQFGSIEDELVSNVTLLVGLLIAGYSLQDVAREFLPTARKMAAATESKLDDTLVEVAASVLKE